MGLSVIKVETKRQYKDFIRFSLDLYQNEDKYIPTLNKVDNLIFSDEGIKKFLIYFDEIAVARFAYFIKDNVAYIVCFDTRKNQQIVNLAIEQIKQDDVSKIYGPISLNRLCANGLLVDSLNRSGSVLAPYNANYYEKLLIDANFNKVKEENYYLLNTDNIDKTNSDQYIIKDQISKTELNQTYKKEIIKLLGIKEEVYKYYLPLIKSEFVSLAFLNNDLVGAAIGICHDLDFLKLNSGIIKRFDKLKINKAYKTASSIDVIVKSDNEEIDELLIKDIASKANRNNIKTLILKNRPYDELYQSRGIYQLILK